MHHTVLENDHTVLENDLDFSIIVIQVRNFVEVNFVTSLLSFDVILITMKCSDVKAPLVLTCLISDGKYQS